MNLLQALVSYEMNIHLVSYCISSVNSLGKLVKIPFCVEIDISHQSTEAIKRN